MNEQQRVDHLFRTWLESETPSAPVGLLDRIDIATRSRRPRPAWVAGLAGHHLDVVGAGERRRIPRLGLVLAIIGLILAAAAFGAFIASQQPSIVVNPSPSPEASATPSLTAESSPAPSLEPSFEPTPARFVTAGSLIDGRFQHSATLLSDGRVLITGGSGAHAAHEQSYLTSTEVWDPLTNATTASGATDPGVDPLLRTTQTAILLPDSRVLIVPGGCWCRPMPSAPAEVWDPSSGAWQPVPALTLQRVGHSATLLADGRVLIAGGLREYFGGPGNALSDAVLWDPVRGTSTVTGSLITARSLHSATLLADGRVLVIGGNNGVPVGEGADLVSSAEVWDPRTGTFGVVPSLAGVRGTAVTLDDGRVLVVSDSSALLWDPSDQSVMDAGSLAQPRSGGQTVTLLADGRVIIVGGYNLTAPDAAADPVLVAELWDPKTLAFEAAGTLSTQRTGHTTTALPDGRALIAGGAFGDFAGSPLQLLEVWEPPRG